MTSMPTISESPGLRSECTLKDSRLNWDPSPHYDFPKTNEDLMGQSLREELDKRA